MLFRSRDNLKGTLYEMLGDGVLTEEEQEVLNREAKRLHLSKEEVNQMIAQAKKIYDREHDTHGMPIHKIAANPELAVEHFKQKMGELRQLALMTDSDQFQHVAMDKHRLSELDYDIWKRIQS